MTITVQELREMAARGENLTAGEILEVAEQLEQQAVYGKTLAARNSILNNMVKETLDVAASSKTIETISYELQDTTRNPMYNAFEMRQFVHAFEMQETRIKRMAATIAMVDSISKQKTSAQDIIGEIQRGADRVFSTWEVVNLLTYLRKSGLTRTPKKNVKEVFDLLKAGNEELYYASEIYMIRQWGQDHERNTDTIKRRFGKAFSEPYAYSENGLSFILTASQKKDMLKRGVIQANSYQDALYFRPDCCDIPEGWRPKGPQLHAGPHFHTDDKGLWWCGVRLADLSGRDLAQFLETTLAELRLLYITFPKGIVHEKDLPESETVHCQP